MDGFVARVRRAGYFLPAGLTGYLLLKGFHPGLPGWGCPLRDLTGVPCPTCFLTRATAASLRGDWSGAIELHAFGPLAALVLLVWSVQSIRSRRLVPVALQAWQVVWPCLALLAYWGVRMVRQYGFGAAAFPAA
jgi:hypothetical protein